MEKCQNQSYSTLSISAMLESKIAKTFLLHKHTDVQYDEMPVMCLHLVHVRFYWINKTLYALSFYFSTARDNQRTLTIHLKPYSQFLFF